MAFVYDVIGNGAICRHYCRRFNDYMYSHPSVPVLVATSCSTGTSTKLVTETHYSRFDAKAQLFLEAVNMSEIRAETLRFGMAYLYKRVAESHLWSSWTCTGICTGSYTQQYRYQYKTCN